MAVIFDGDDAKVAPSGETSVTSLEEKKINITTSYVDEKYLQ
jgi:hypothetical protein